ncbi:myo-inositol-1-phosphate synthase, partial [Trypanosoma cruzi]
MPTVRVQGDRNVQYTEEAITAKYVYRTTRVKESKEEVIVGPVNVALRFRTLRKRAKCGLMMVGWGGNNGSTVTAGILANKHGLTWRTKKGVLHPNYFGSITQSSTLNLGMTSDMKEVFVPLKDVVPMINPNDLAIGGWDCSGMSLVDAMHRAQVLDVALQDALYEYMRDMKPLPAVFDLDFVAENQQERADNILSVQHKWEAVEKLRSDIR